MQTHTILLKGHAKPKGSMTPFFNRKKKRLGMHNSSALTTNWLKSAKSQIKKLWKHPIIEADTAVSVAAVFHLPQPKTVKRKYPIARYSGDLDKLMRGIFDCMTGIVYVDDVQVMQESSTKVYTKEEPFVVITIKEVK
jgi:Holliday junction resolvase RusA-like endonuclease